MKATGLKNFKRRVESFIEIHLLTETSCVNVSELLLNLPVFN